MMDALTGVEERRRNPPDTLRVSVNKLKARAPVDYLARHDNEVAQMHISPLYRN